MVLESVVGLLKNKYNHGYQEFNCRKEIGVAIG